MKRARAVKYQTICMLKVLVELMRFELTTSAVRLQRSPI